MRIKNSQMIVLVLLMLLCITSIAGFENGGKSDYELRFYAQQTTELKLYGKNRNHFTLHSGEECKLINSAIKQDYQIYFSGNIVNFDTLVIGKGSGKYLSGYVLINQDSIIFCRITHGKIFKSYKHHFSLKNHLSISIDRKADSAIVTMINEKDTLKITSDFVGMNHPFVRSSGSVIDVDQFEFNCADYYSDVYVFGDSYVNCGNPQRWPYYLYHKGFQFFCDGLPGGRSGDSYEFFHSALSVHKPRYVIWCLGMNDKSDQDIPDPDWKSYVHKVMDDCARNNVTLILATIPTVPSRNHKWKNEFIRKSGYRYIDFDQAVSDGNGNWKTGMLAADGVHPTKTGAKAMAEEFLKDFTEIKNYPKQSDK